MHDAARRGHQGIVDILLQHGADVNVKNDNGKLILFIHTYFIIGDITHKGKLIICIHACIIIDNITQYTFKFIIPDIYSVENKIKKYSKNNRTK